MSDSTTKTRGEVVAAETVADNTYAPNEVLITGDGVTILLLQPAGFSGSKDLLRQIIAALIDRECAAAVRAALDAGREGKETR